MAKIESAFLGDELSSQNITNSIRDRIDNGNGRIDVEVNSSLIPLINRPQKIELTGNERDEIEKKAVEQCGGAFDSRCVEFAKAKLQASKLEEKEKEATSTANMVKGRRLTVKYTDETGKKQTAIIPEGQRFQLGVPESTLSTAKVKTSSEPFKFPSLTGTALELFKILSVIVLTFLFAASVALTYKTTMLSGYNRYLAYGLTAAAVFIPYSGFVISLLVAAIAAYMESKKNSA
jgi:hypothetical protein